MPIHIAESLQPNHKHSISMLHLPAWVYTDSSCELGVLTNYGALNKIFSKGPLFKQLACPRLLES